MMTARGQNDTQLGCIHSQKRIQLYPNLRVILKGNTPSTKEGSDVLRSPRVCLYLQYSLSTKKYIFPISSSWTAALIYFTLPGKPKELWMSLG